MLLVEYPISELIWSFNITGMTVLWRARVIEEQLVVSRKVQTMDSR